MKQMLENRAEGFQPAQPDAIIYLLISERKNSMGGSRKDPGLGKVMAKSVKLHPAAFSPVAWPVTSPHIVKAEQYWWEPWAPPPATSLVCFYGN